MKKINADIENVVHDVDSAKAKTSVINISASGINVNKVQHANNEMQKSATTLHIKESALKRPPSNMSTL